MTFNGQHIEKRLDILWRKQSELVIKLPNLNNNSLIDVLLLFGLMNTLVLVSYFVFSSDNLNCRPLKTSKVEKFKSQMNILSKEHMNVLKQTEKRKTKKNVKRKTEFTNFLQSHHV